MRAKIIIVALVIGMVWSNEQASSKADGGASVRIALASGQGEKK
ncbi:hypothetical protein SAMN05216386_0884 [Nitrosospira briensis]|uniref:Uncharacterized protein n=1 Tax=Nitrosospira briensis TaxID=35799 RepID=A0A1I4YTV2_9PROT|nr:hypothetical protein [Nitrosospira briensis]SFN41455.1 hypothetical protein SAMN05216386_0884 [Nitrosospira briensis]